MILKITIKKISPIQSSTIKKFQNRNTYHTKIGIDSISQPQLMYITILAYFLLEQHSNKDKSLDAVAKMITFYIEKIRAAIILNSMIGQHCVAAVG